MILLSDEGMSWSFSFCLSDIMYKYLRDKASPPKPLSRLDYLSMGSSSVSLPTWDVLIQKVALKLPNLEDTVSDKMHESFPFFNLPDVVIRKILKEYIPVPDKANALSEIEAFQPYLALNSVWYQPSLTLYRLMEGLEPGWYVGRNDPYVWYHVSVDYFNLTLTFFTFCILFSDSKDLRHTSKTSVSCSNVKQALEIFRNFNVIRYHPHNILMYRLKRKCYALPTFCWIFVQENIVFWRDRYKPYPLKQNQCFIPEWEAIHDHGMILTLEKDGTVIINCPVSSNKKCNYEIRLSPILFQVCDKTFLIPTSVEAPNILHAHSTLTFSNFGNDPLYMTCKQFLKNTYW